MSTFIICAKYVDAFAMCVIQVLCLTSNTICRHLVL